MPVIAVVLLVLLGLVVLIPVSIVQRFRMGTARRQGRHWVATINLVGAVASVLALFVVALITNRWVPETFAYTVAGFALGGAIGALGTGLTRWEDGGRHLHYTPNRWLVLAVTLVVAVRLVYGFWRTWEAWHLSIERGALVAASGVAGSTSAGAVVLGYYLVFWSGVRHRVRRHRQRK